MMLSEMSRLNWPNDVPLPSDAEFRAAQKRYEATLHPDDQTDWGIGLGFVMATYNRLLWLEFFFPEKRDEYRAEEAKILARARVA